MYKIQFIPLYTVIILGRVFLAVLYSEEERLQHKRHNNRHHNLKTLKTVVIPRKGTYVLVSGIAQEKKSGGKPGGGEGFGDSDKNWYT